MKALALAAAVTVLAIASPAQGDDASTSTEPMEELAPSIEEDPNTVPAPVDIEVERGLDHKGQFGAHVTMAKGYRAIFPYDNEQCSDDPARDVCNGGAPLTLDLGLTYGVTAGLELLVEARIGLEEEDFLESRAVALMPGLKLIFEPNGSLKFFLATQAIIDSTDHSNAGVEDLDLGLRAALGIQLDLMRQLGFYIQGGANIGVRRWFSFLGEGGAGVEVRFP